MKAPPLRFKEFTTPWEEKKLGEIFTISAGGDIDQSSVSQEKNDIFKFPIYANAEKKNGLYGYSDEYKIAGNCVTVTGRGNLGIAKARTEYFYPIVRLLCLISKDNNSDIFLSTLSIKPKFTMRVRGSHN